jgi:hypothetical protein
VRTSFPAGWMVNFSVQVAEWTHIYDTKYRWLRRMS